MYTVVIKFNNGSVSSFTYTEPKISMLTLITDIGNQQFPERYNPKINQYIKIIYMGKIADTNDEIIFDPSKSEQSYHCVIKKIPDDAFIIEKSKTMEPEEVHSLLTNPKFSDLIKQRIVYEYLTDILDSPEKLIDLICGKTQSVKTNPEHLVVKYAQQIQVLKDMGFTDEKELVVLLSNTNGNVENVINILMS